MGAGSDYGLAQIDPATAYVRDGAAAINALGDNITTRRGGVWYYEELVSATSVPTAAFTVVGLDSLVMDDIRATAIGVTASGEFSAPAAGRYEIQGYLAFAAAASAGTRRAAAIAKNNVIGRNAQSILYATPAILTVVVTPLVILDLALNDKITLQAYQDAGAARSTSNAAGSTSAMIVRRLK